MTWRFLKSGASYQNGPQRMSTLPSLFTSAAQAPSAQKYGWISVLVQWPSAGSGGVDCASAVSGATRESRARWKSFMAGRLDVLLRGGFGGKRRALPLV